MKVALIVTSLYTSGPSIFTRSLAVGLQRLNVEVHLFYFDQILEIEIPCPKTRLNLYRGYDFSDFDIVHSTGFRPDLYCAFVAKAGRWQKITAMHNFMEEDLLLHYGRLKAWAGAFVWRRAVRSIGRIIVSSEQMQSYYKGLFGAQLKATLIPYGMDPPPAESRVDDDDITLIHGFRERGLHLMVACGVLIKRKGFDTLLTAVARSPGVALLLIGSGPEGPQLRQLAGELKIHDRVAFLGTKKDSFRYYRHCDLYAHTSLSEGFGLAMIESLAQGLPLICADLRIYDNFFGRDEVVRFEPGNVEALVAAIGLALNEAKELSRKSVAIYTRHFTLEKMAARHLSLYENMLCAPKL